MSTFNNIYSQSNLILSCSSTKVPLQTNRTYIFVSYIISHTSTIRVFMQKALDVVLVFDAKEKECS